MKTIAQRTTIATEVETYYVSSENNTTGKITIQSWDTAKRSIENRMNKLKMFDDVDRRTYLQSARIVVEPKNNYYDQLTQSWVKIDKKENIEIPVPYKYSGDINKSAWDEIRYLLNKDMINQPKS